MILIWKNTACLVLEKLENLGPEPHYKCLFKNKEIVLTKHSSGLIGNLLDYSKDQIPPDINARGFGYYLENGKLHRENNLPASEYYDETFFYFLKGERHRLDGFSVESKKENYIRNEYWVGDISYGKNKAKYKKAVKDFLERKINDSKL